MDLKWTNKALSDLVRLYEFLAPVNQAAAARVIQELTSAPFVLLSTPRIGRQLTQFEPREVRRMLVGQYEIRYELRRRSVYVLRLWHNRENRQEG